MENFRFDFEFFYVSRNYYFELIDCSDYFDRFFDKGNFIVGLSKAIEIFYY